MVAKFIRPLRALDMSPTGRYLPVKLNPPKPANVRAETQLLGRSCPFVVAETVASTLRSRSRPSVSIRLRVQYVALRSVADSPPDSNSRESLPRWRKVLLACESSRSRHHLILVWFQISGQLRHCQRTAAVPLQDTACIRSFNWLGCTL